MWIETGKNTMFDSDDFGSVSESTFNIGSNDNPFDPDESFPVLLFYGVDESNRKIIFESKAILDAAFERITRALCRNMGFVDISDLVR